LILYDYVVRNAQALWHSIGAEIGGLFWGFISDRFGRRIAAQGFVFAATIIKACLFVPMPIWLLELTCFTYDIMLSCSAIWGSRLCELYPQHLRSTAAPIFNW
jgi:MFS family permease